MNIRIHGNAVAIALASAAVLITATGTAVAVTATKVNIADPTKPAQIAHVDSSGRLSTSGVTANLNYLVTSQGTLQPRDVFVTSATLATIAVTRISVTPLTLDPGPAGYVKLIQTAAFNDGRCDPSTTLRTFSFQSVHAMEVLVDDYPTPLLAKGASPGVKTCLDVQIVSLDDFAVQFTGYVVNGTYTGIGTAIDPGPGRILNPHAADQGRSRP